jgi:hypothetical protein
MTGVAEAVKFELVEGIGPAPKRRRKKKKRSGLRLARKRIKARAARRTREWLRKYKLEHPCACGERDPACLDFHHIGETKNRELSDARSINSAMAELPFCIVICANCHRKLHAREETRDDQMDLLA